MKQSDIIIIGGGVAGLSAAARLAGRAAVVVLEGEEALGYHSSGRSATFSHFGIGDEVVRGLTAHSKAFFEAPPESFCATPLSRASPVLYVGTEQMLDRLETLYGEIARINASIEWVDEQGLLAFCPVLRTGPGALVRGFADPAGLRLDADLLLQSYAKSVRGCGGEVLTGRRVAAVERRGDAWIVRSEAGEEWTAPLLVNAAGAWADVVAQMAGVKPLGLQPMRRTIIVVDCPEGSNPAEWAFTLTAIRDFYMLPESGRLLASPVDEIPTDPCDAWAEEYDMALAAAKLEEYTTLQVRRIAHNWAGLRSFVSDRVPTAGFAPDAPGFFWLAGQGGYGLQTAPAMAEITEALLFGEGWPQTLDALGVTADKILPDRLTRETI